MMNVSDKYMFSVIVPVYNVAGYVEQCIRSLYHQDIPSSDYEVIVVDDCSPDNSKDIVQSLQSEYQNLKLISLSENMKLGSARNVGLQNAEGKYIWFVDSDDFVEPDVLKLFYTELEKENLEILHFDYKEFSDIDKKLVPYRVNYELSTCSGIEFYFDSHELWWQKGVEAWRKIYRRSFLLENNLFFAEKVMYEDVDYSFKVFAKAQRVKHIDFSPYCYRDNSSSITKTKLTPVHLKYWLLLALRCEKLQKQFLDELVDSRFITVIDEYNKYQLEKIYCTLKTFDKEQREVFKTFLKDLDISSLRKYISIKKYLYLKYPIN